jgi:hypothetical protein
VRAARPRAATFSSWATGFSSLFVAISHSIPAAGGRQTRR